MISYCEYMSKKKYMELTSFFLMGPEQEKIRNWCKRNELIKEPRLLWWLRKYHEWPDGVSYPEPWEEHLYLIWNACVMANRLSAFDKTPKSERVQFISRVSKLARQLADSLDEEICPDVPSLLKVPEWLMEARQKKYDEYNSIRNGQGLVVDSVDDNGSNVRCDVYEYHGATEASRRKEVDKMVRAYFHEEIRREKKILHLAGGIVQRKLPGLLRRLAESFERELSRQIKDARPSTGNPDARVLARHLASFFKEHFDRTPNNVIAACILLAFPDIDPPPNEDTIRDWRGAR